jgi:hypothetical protein
VQSETHLVLRGFDAIVYPSEDPGDNFQVILSEGGNEVYDVSIPIPVDEDSDEAYSDDYIEFAAQAAIDWYEAGRGTLGQGAGATMQDTKPTTPSAPAPAAPAPAAPKASRKRAGASMEYEDWYMTLKGTKFEEQATVLMEQYMDLYHSAGDSQPSQLTQLYDQERAIMQELDRLNFERMKAADPNETVIVISASSNCKNITAYGLYDAESIQEYLGKFKHSPLEVQAIAKTKELMDVRTLIRNMEKSDSDDWEAQSDMRAAMDELLLQYIHQNALESAPDTGLESAPAMAADLAELMEGVDLNSPLEPMIAGKQGLEDVEPVEDRAEELGDQHEYLDPAEVPLDDRKFQEGDKVTFSKEYEDVGAGGAVSVVPKGTSAVVNSSWDGAGDLILVVLESGRVVRVPGSALSK